MKGHHEKAKEKEVLMRADSQLVVTPENARRYAEVIKSVSDEIWKREH